MEPTAKQVLESQVYQIQKAIISREVNGGNPDNYYIERNSKGQPIFKKTDEEKALLANLKAKWLKEMRAKFPGFTKRSAGKKKFLQTIIDGENTKIN